MKRKITLLLMLLLINYIVFAQKINAITANQTAVLGSAYQSEKEAFVGQECVSGDSTLTGVSQSTFDFSQSLTAKQASDQLGFSIGGKARFGAYTASAAARFMKSSISSSFSISSVWLSEYVLPTLKDVLKGGIWKSRKQLIDQLMKYVKTYNEERAKPFRWTYTGKPLTV